MTTPLTPATLRALIAKATPAPWKGVPFRLRIGDTDGPLMSYQYGDRGSHEGLLVSVASERIADHELIAFLRNHAEAIAAALEERDAFHRVMALVGDMQLDHGLCLPRSRRACTHCNATDDLAAMFRDYKGPHVTHNAARKEKA